MKVRTFVVDGVKLRFASELYSEAIVNQVVINELEEELRRLEEAEAHTKRVYFRWIKRVHNKIETLLIQGFAVPERGAMSKYWKELLS